MLESLKKDIAVLRDGTTGRRFRDFLQYKKGQRSEKKPIARLLTFATGLLLLIGGLAIGWLPGPGGFIALIGLALLAREIPGIAQAMDYCEWALIRLYCWFQKLPIWMRCLAGAVVIVIIAVAAWAAYQLLGQ